MMPRNHRKFMRVNIGSTTSMGLLDPTGIADRTLDVTLVNLSAGGAQIVANESILTSQPIRLGVKSADPPLEMNVIGRVIRADMKAADGTFRCGIKFSTMSDADRVTLTRFVLRLALKTGQGADRIVRDPAPVASGVV